MGFLLMLLSWLVENWRVIAAIAAALLVLQALSWIGHELSVLVTLVKDVVSKLAAISDKLGDDSGSPTALDGIKEELRNSRFVLEAIRDDLSDSYSVEDSKRKTRASADTTLSELRERRQAALDAAAQACKELQGELQGRRP